MVHIDHTIQKVTANYGVIKKENRKMGICLGEQDACVISHCFAIIRNMTKYQRQIRSVIYGRVTQDGGNTKRYMTKIGTKITII